MLQSMGLQRVRHNLATEQQQYKVMIMIIKIIANEATDIGFISKIHKTMGKGCTGPASPRALL